MQKPGVFNFAPSASPACRELGISVLIFIQDITRALHQKKSFPDFDTPARSGEVFVSVKCLLVVACCC
jgi:xanthine dehydrogenase molybdopterin-binding subunit B